MLSTQAFPDSSQSSSCFLWDRLGIWGTGEQERTKELVSRGLKLCALNHSFFLRDLLGA